MASVVNQYGFEKPAPVVWNANPETEDQPLQFGPPKTLAICHSADADDKERDASELCSESAVHCSEHAAAENFGGKSCNGPPAKEVVGVSKASSAGEERLGTLDFTCHRTEDNRLELDKESGETVSSSSRCAVDVPVTVSSTLAEKVNCELTPAVTDRSDAAISMNSQSKGPSTTNVLNLDYSDSSDENL